MDREDGLTSRERKKKFTNSELYELAIEAKDYYLQNGWRVLKSKDVNDLKEGDEIRCCEWECGCYGQIEKIELGKVIAEDLLLARQVLYHSNHEEVIGVKYLNHPDRGGLNIIALIRE